MFMTYRLVTAGPTGFEMAKSYYLNPNIISMRHMAVRLLVVSLPLFVASTSCMVLVSFGGNENMIVINWLPLPICLMLLLAAFLFAYTNFKHNTIFKEKYTLAKLHSEPLMAHMDAMSTRSRNAFIDL
mmetsp:Transcript_63400/g.139521  ORF Transcript_63400/g.139521 Transcript_63400/m.139521 type:complete len:128 (-) Transcript_63400:40-423(-)